MGKRWSKPKELSTWWMWPRVIPKCDSILGGVSVKVSMTRSEVPASQPADPPVSQPVRGYVKGNNGSDGAQLEASSCPRGALTTDHGPLTTFLYLGQIYGYFTLNVLPPSAERGGHISIHLVTKTVALTKGGCLVGMQAPCVVRIAWSLWDALKSMQVALGPADRSRA